METGKIQPERKFRAGGVTATIWQNTSEKGSFATVQLSRSYMGKDNTWKETNSYRVGDLPKVALVLNEAFKHLQLKDGAQGSMQVAEQKMA